MFTNKNRLRFSLSDSDLNSRTFEDCNNLTEPDVDKAVQCIKSQPSH